MRWLILDCNYLCHRAFHAMGQLSHGDVPTGVLFGFLRDMLTLQDDHNTDRVIFCFDGMQSLRRGVYPEYKLKRSTKKREPQEAEAYKGMRRQVRALCETHLHEIGYRNVFCQEGYEADDLIASLCVDRQIGDNYIIVSADKDLYQLLHGRAVICWNPQTRRVMTEDKLMIEFGVSPLMWADVKAIAGCETDEIKGIKGVGEKTAAKFITGALSSDSLAFAAIVKGNKIWKRNLHLVKLPYPGCESFDLRHDRVTDKRWNKFVSSMGMRSLVGNSPKFGF